MRITTTRSWARSWQSELARPVESWSLFVIIILRTERSLSDWWLCVWLTRDIRNMAKIAIIGLGLIGGSIGMALKSANLRDLRLAGYSRNPGTRSRARQKGAVDEAAVDLTSCVEGASMVILATPVISMEGILQAIAPFLGDGCVVTDAASTKQLVGEWASKSLPQGVSFVGGHPMAGKETAGIEAAEPGLFKGCTYCICPSPSAAPAAVESVVGMTNLLGARPYFIDALEHDSYVAAISHLPMLLSTALVSATTGSPAWKEMSRLASSGFRDTTRLASSDPVMSRDIYLTNRESLGRWVDALIDEIQSLRSSIAAGETGLEDRLSRIKEARDRWQRGEPPGEVPKVEEPAGGWGHFLLGRLSTQISNPRVKRP